MAYSDNTSDTVAIEAFASDYKAAIEALGFLRRSSAKRHYDLESVNDAIRAINTQATDSGFSVVELPASVLNSVWGALSHYQTDCDNPRGEASRFAEALLEAEDEA